MTLPARQKNTREDFAGGERYDAILDIGDNSRLSRLRRAPTATGTLVIVGGETGGCWLGGIDRQLRATLLSPFVGQHLGTFISAESADDLLALRALEGVALPRRDPRTQHGGDRRPAFARRDRRAGGPAAQRRRPPSRAGERPGQAGVRPGRLLRRGRR